MHYSNSNAIEQIARSIDAGSFEAHVRPQSYQRLLAASLGGISVLLVAAAFLAALV